MQLDDRTCHAAIDAKDRRYDGQFFVGVTSTGIYCRSVCPARTPMRRNRRFFASTAAAEKGGFRPCLICRPELAPGAAPMDAADRIAHAAVRRIESGALEEHGLERLAADLGVTGRHLRRVMLRTFGAAPVEIAQTHRLLAAKRLLHETDLGMAQVAFAAGFQSLRRFNALFRDRYGMAPTDLRKRPHARSGKLRFTLVARGRFDGAAVLEHLRLRRIERMEMATGPNTWTRTLRLGAQTGWLTLDLSGEVPMLELSDGLVPVFRRLITEVRGALDLDTDVDAINVDLLQDAQFAPDVAAEPAVRLPGGLDAFEIAVRAVIGQQVTVKAATTVATRLVERIGTPIATEWPGLDRLFPTPEEIVDAGRDTIAALGMPGARAETLVRLAAAVADGSLRLSRGAVALGRAGLTQIAGIGPWTIEYVALRGLGDPDAFPLGDSALSAAYDGDLKRAHENWRPWRAYAAARLWRRHAKMKGQTA